MRSIKFEISNPSASAWDCAVALTEAYLSQNCKADELLDRLPDSISGQRRASCQSLFLGALRHGHRTRAALKPMLRKAPRPTVEAVFLVAGYELLSESQEKHPKVVHHAVERAKKLVKKAELGLINAVLRKLQKALHEIPSEQAPAFYSHPDWLVEHWNKEFGPEATTKLLDWNQQIPSNYLKTAGSPPVDLEATDWPNFYKLSSGQLGNDIVRALLASGAAYIKDPSTRIAPSLLDVQPGETVLDLCAAPGGKAYDMAQGMSGSGSIVAVDLSGPRIERLRENLNRLKVDTSIVESDILELSTEQLEAANRPTTYDAVMLDAPCSNTGVIQRRTDVKWRLRSRDIEACAKLQLQLLHSASRFVKPGGRLVYSTCSIETDENQAVVDAFLASKSGQSFKLSDSIQSYPWETGHDGAGAFRLVRKTDA